MIRLLMTYVLNLIHIYSKIRLIWTDWHNPEQIYRFISAQCIPIKRILLYICIKFKTIV